MRFGWLALAASAPVAAQPVTPVAPVTIAPTDRWVVAASPVDLPPGVQSTGDTRVVELRYAPAAGGRVTQCTVTRSSGEPALDAESCRILRGRGYIPRLSQPTSGLLRFAWRGGAPTGAGQRGGPLLLDYDDGNRVNGQPLNYTSGWAQSAAIAAASDQGPATYRITVSETGTSLGCRVTSGRRGARRYARYQCEGQRNFIPASDGAGGTRRSFYDGMSEVRTRPTATPR